MPSLIPNFSDLTLKLEQSLLLMEKILIELRTANAHLSVLAAKAEFDRYGPD